MSKVLTQLQTQLGAILSDESGQGAAEYASISVLLLGSLAGASLMSPIVKRFFEGLQLYVDLYFYALNLALG